MLISTKTALASSEMVQKPFEISKTNKKSSRNSKKWPNCKEKTNSVAEIVPLENSSVGKIVPLEIGIFLYKNPKNSDGKIVPLKK